MFEFTKELAEYYFSPWIKVLKAALPPGLGKKGLKLEIPPEKKITSSYKSPILFPKQRTERCRIANTVIYPQGRAQNIPNPRYYRQWQNRNLL